MNPALLIPLSSLPAPAPMMTPVIFHIAGLSLSTAYPGAGVDRSDPSSHYDVDLSPPPIDSAGRPTRIDALPVLVDMLARAMGHPEGQRAFHSMQRRVSGAVVTFWTLFTAPVSSYVQEPRTYTETTFSVINVCGTTSTDDGAETFGGTGPGVPALATILPTAPNATRTALAALFAARVWEKQ